MPKQPTIESIAVAKGIQSLRLYINLAIFAGVAGALLATGAILVRSTGGKRDTSGPMRKRLT